MRRRDSLGVCVSRRINTGLYADRPSGTQHDSAVLCERPADVDRDASSAAQCQLKMIRLQVADGSGELMKADSAHDFGDGFAGWAGDRARTRWLRRWRGGAMLRACPEQSKDLQLLVAGDVDLAIGNGWDKIRIAVYGMRPGARLNRE